MSHFFSVIMPSYLGSYDRAASNREYKLKRAIESVLNQSYKEFELIVVADGCQKTIDICKQYNITSIFIPKQPLFSGTVRQIGVDNAVGNMITYLDSDDTIGKDHLKYLAEFNNCELITSCDYVYKNAVWSKRMPMLKINHIGTSNITHKNGFGSWVNCDGYGHDFDFIRSILHEKPIIKINNNGQYYVHHTKYGYDL